MNFERPLFGRLTVNGTQISLGNAGMKELVRRLISQLSNHRLNGYKIQILLEVSSEQLTNSLLSREQALSQELNSLMLSDPNEEIFPGINFARVTEVMESEEYQQYSVICNPDKRIGVDNELINQIKSAYATRFPDCIEHFPKWVESG